MKSLATALKGDDVFTSKTEIKELVEEYYQRSERKRNDDKWLKENKPFISQALREMGKDKADFGQLRVTVSIPDQSYFDEDAVLNFALSKGVYELVTKSVLDEDALMQVISKGLIDLDELKEVAWVEKQGTERVLLKKVKADE